MVGLAQKGLREGDKHADDGTQRNIMNLRIIWAHFRALYDPSVQHPAKLRARACELDQL